MIEVTGLSKRYGTYLAVKDVSFSIEKGEVIGYEFVSLGKMTDFIKKGMEPNEAYKKAMGTYGRFSEAAKYIDPRKE